MAQKDSKKDNTVMVNIQEFTRTRDSVIVGLAALQSAVSDLSRAYINHANTVLQRAPSSIDLSANLSTTLLENGLLQSGISPGFKSEAGEKKKRKRAPHDPNAPKRALTPYFLYMQHNRANIARELGPNAKPKEVADEGTRRWAEMPDAEKSHWKDLYAENLAVYKEKMAAYKSGHAAPEVDADKEAADQLHESAAAAEASTEESEEEEEEASPEPVKEPTPPRSTKRRRTGDAVKTPAKEAASPAVNKKASPEKKKRAAPAPKKDAETNEKPKRGAAAAAAAAADEKKKPNKKKRKSEAE